MLDTTPITDTIRHLISTGTTERDLLAAVARKFPELTLTEFVAAPRDASGGAEGSTATLRRRQASASVPHDRSTPKTGPRLLHRGTRQLCARFGRMQRSKVCTRVATLQ